MSRTELSALTTHKAQPSVLVNRAAFEATPMSEFGLTCLAVNFISVTRDIEFRPARLLGRYLISARDRVRSRRRQYGPRSAFLDTLDAELINVTSIPGMCVHTYILAHCHAQMSELPKLPEAIWFSPIASRRHSSAKHIRTHAYIPIV